VENQKPASFLIRINDFLCKEKNTPNTLIDNFILDYRSPSFRSPIDCLTFHSYVPLVSCLCRTNWRLAISSSLPNRDSVRVVITPLSILVHTTLQLCYKLQDIQQRVVLRAVLLSTVPSSYITPPSYINHTSNGATYRTST
jgi:hypothetical protein